EAEEFIQMSVMDEVGAAKQQSQTDKKTDDAERAVHSAESCGVNLNITAGHCAHCTAPSSTTNPQNRPDGHRSYWLRRLTERQCSANPIWMLYSSGFFRPQNRIFGAFTEILFSSSIRQIECV